MLPQVPTLPPGASKENPLSLSPPPTSTVVAGPLFNGASIS